MPIRYAIAPSTDPSDLDAAGPRKLNDFDQWVDAAEVAIEMDETNPLDEGEWIVVEVFE